MRTKVNKFVNQKKGVFLKKRYTSQILVVRRAVVRVIDHHFRSHA